MWRFLLILSLLSLPVAVWAYSAGIEARVLPSDEANILSVESFEIVELGENHAVFEVKTNLPAGVKLLYGNTWQKDQVFDDESMLTEHQFTLIDLRPATLYYYRLYLFNDKDSISLGDQVFKTTGQPNIEWWKSISASHEKSSKVSKQVLTSNLTFTEELSETSTAGNLFSVADLSFLLLCLSIFLLLLAILKHCQKEIKN